MARARRAWVAWAEAFRVSTRRACRATGVARSTVTYRARRPSPDALRRRLRELAQTRVSFGYRRLHVLLRRDGWPVNLKRVRRLYREEGLSLVRRPARRKSGRRTSITHRLTAQGRVSAPYRGRGCEGGRLRQPLWGTLA